MKCCFLLWGLLVIAVVVDGQQDYFEERVAQVNEELRKTWGRGSVGRWPEPKAQKDESPNYKVQVLLPLGAKLARSKEFLPQKAIDDLPMEICGLHPAEDRITNGDVASLTQFPWLARIYYLYEFKCAGALISSNFVLTASHCIPRTLDVSSLETLQVVFGEHNVRTDPDCDEDDNCVTTTTVSVQKRIVHEKFKDGYYGYDIGLLKLAKSVPMGDEIVPICLPLYEELATIKKDESYVVAGWGITETGEPSDVKRFVELLPMDVDECKKAHRGVDPMIHICAGGQADGKDSCSGDSGGPLMSVGTVNDSKRFIAVGVLSIGGPKCGEVGVPGVYERVYTHLSWILEKMSN